MMRAPRLFLLALALCVAACAGQQMPLPPSPEWVDFYSAPSRHAASFPEKPKASLKEDATPGGLRTFSYLQEVQSASRYFGTGWIPVATVPPDKAGRDRLLDIAAAAALKSIPGGTIVATYKPVNEGIEGRMYTIDIPKEKLRMRQQIFFTAAGLVEQTYTGPAGTETDADAERFFSSLRLLP